jgi:hypothetical protein
MTTAVPKALSMPRIINRKPKKGRTVLDNANTYTGQETVSIDLQNPQLAGNTQFLVVCAKDPVEELEGFSKVLESQGQPAVVVYALKDTDPNQRYLYASTELAAVSFTVPGTIVEPGSVVRGTGSVCSASLSSAVGGQVVTVSVLDRGTANVSAPLFERNDSTVAVNVTPFLGGVFSSWILFGASGKIATVQILVRTALGPGEGAP